MIVYFVQVISIRAFSGIRLRACIEEYNISSKVLTTVDHKGDLMVSYALP